MRRRILFHTQHLLGIGHLKRSAILARRMAAAGLEVTVLSGGEAVAGIDFGAAERVPLPPARALDAGFKILVDEHGRPLDQAFHARRTAKILAAFARIKPHAILIETYPFGRRAFRFELDALIAMARAARPRPAILASIRDVLVRKDKPGRNVEIAAQVRRDFDAVLVHGDPALVPLSASFPEATEISDWIRYTGYVTEPIRPHTGSEGVGEVIVSVGGGAVGERLLRAALAAKPQTRLAPLSWRLIAGPNLPDTAYANLAAGAPAGMILERYRPDLPALLARCRLSISQAGYNTILDILQAGVPALVAPFAGGEETEQSLRAQMLAARGYFHFIEEKELDEPEAGAGLARAIDAVLSAPPPARPDFGLDGARRSAALIADFAEMAWPECPGAG